MSQGSKEQQTAISILKHLPAYPWLFGWDRNKLVKALLQHFIVPGPDDYSAAANRKRAFAASYRIDELSRKITPFPNRMPFTQALQMIICFDRLLEFSVKLGINPFEVLPKHINGVTIGMWGNWIGTLQWPFQNIQDAIDRWFIEQCGPRHHVFMTTSDYMLLKLGYLSDRHLEYKDSWNGDRNLPGGDVKLRLTALSASFPMFAYCEKKLSWGPWGEPNYAVKILPSKGEKSKKKSREQRYVRRSYYFGVTRYKRLALVRQMAGHLHIVNRHQEHIRQETW